MPPTGASSPLPTCPGLIEGASEGIGLGHEFLAHLERARVLLHVIDAVGGDAAGALRHDRPRARRLRCRARGAAAGDRAEQDRPAPGAARAGARRRADRRASSASRARPAPGSRSWRALFELCPPPRRRSAPDAPSWPSSSSTGPKPEGRRAYRIYRTDRGFRVIGHAARGRGARGRAPLRRRARGRRGRDRGRGARVALTRSGSSAAPSIRRTPATSRSPVRRSAASTSRGCW